MKKSIGVKITMVLIPILVISSIVLQFLIVSNFKSNSLELSEKNLDMLSKSIFQTIRVTMNMGDPTLVEKALHDAKSIEGVHDLTIHKSQGIIDTFGLNAKVSTEPLIVETFKNAKQQNIIIDDVNKHNLRLIRPLVATDECLSCHTVNKVGDVLGVMDLTYSFKDIDKNISDISYQFIIIFVISLIFTSVAVLYALKVIIGHPLDELLKRVFDLSSGDGDLTQRVTVKSEDEIGEVGTYI
ncbi:MAG: methyl-accepting chemotaxis protein, partial [Campylobacterales bacterium]|nr:methyl-accepting chemotaxis protein [Campylobacterales bacterium]